MKNTISNSPKGRRCCEKIIGEKWKIGSEKKAKRPLRKRFQWKPWTKGRWFVRSNRYIRKKDESSTQREPYTQNNKKNCRCFVCDVKGYFVRDCPRRGKNTQRMIKYMEEQQLKFCLGEEITPTDIILYELEVEDDSDNELVFTMNEDLGPITPPVSELKV